jgi:hypothetical protein
MLVVLCIANSGCCYNYSYYSVADISVDKATWYMLDGLWIESWGL